MTLDPTGEPASPTRAAAVAALVLAAGGGQRFGGPKLLAPFRGRPLAAHSLDAARRALETGTVERVVMVTAAGDAALADLARRAGATVCENAAPELGLASSLQRGLEALETAAAAATGAVLVMLADQPLVRLEVLDRLVAAWRARQGTLFRPRYLDTPDQPGHPVLADRSLWPRAMTLSGDRGFASLLPPNTPSHLQVDAAGRNPDIDTPDDLTALEGSCS